MWQFCRCVRTHQSRVRTQNCTASLSRGRARTQRRDGRSQLRERPGIGGSAFDRKNYVRPHCRRLIFQNRTETKKNKQKRLTFFFLIFIFFWILSIQKHEINKIIAQLKITSRKIKLV
jgi:hypothetical protein